MISIAVRLDKSVSLSIGAALLLAACPAAFANEPGAAVVETRLIVVQPRQMPSPELWPAEAITYLDDDRARQLAHEAARRGRTFHTLRSLPTRDAAGRLAYNSLDQVRAAMQPGDADDDTPDVAAMMQRMAQTAVVLGAVEVDEDPETGRFHVRFDLRAVADPAPDAIPAEGELYATVTGVRLAMNLADGQPTLVRLPLDASAVVPQLEAGDHVAYLFVKASRFEPDEVDVPAGDVDGL